MDINHAPKHSNHSEKRLKWDQWSHCRYLLTWSIFLMRSYTAWRVKIINPQGKVSEKYFIYSYSRSNYNKIIIRIFLKPKPNYKYEQLNVNYLSWDISKLCWAYYILLMVVSHYYLHSIVSLFHNICFHKFFLLHLHIYLINEPILIVL